MAAREQALALGLPVVFDPNVRLHRWDSPGRVMTVAGECVRDAFLVKCNREEARLLTGEDDPERAAESLWRAGARHVVVTLGADGAILRGELSADVPGEPAAVIDATGAGDAFLGVLLARLSSSGLLRARARGGAAGGRRGRRARHRAVGRGRLTAEPRRADGRRVRAIRERLRRVYGVPEPMAHGHPIAELVLTVLSQSTNDRNRDVAYLRLRERFATWEAVRDAPLEEIEEAIRPGGISKVKSVRIQAILEAIGDPLDLDWLADAPVAGGTRLPLLAAGSGPQDGGVRPALHVRRARRARSTRTWARVGSASACCRSGRASTRCTTRWSR